VTLLAATVTSGFGAASQYRLQAETGFPWPTVPGTLNINVHGVAKCHVSPRGEIEWFDHVEEWWLGTVQKPGSPYSYGVVILGIDEYMNETKLELLSPFHLRDVLDVENGDEVTLAVWE